MAIAAIVCIAASLFALMVEGVRLEKLKQDYEQHCKHCNCDEVGGDYLP